MEKEKILSTLEEIKIISDPFRLQILFLYDDEMIPLTVKQMAVKLEEVPSKVHYHVKELERIGVLELVETKERAGILEKFYLPTAKTFRVEKSLTAGAGEPELGQVEANVFKAMQEDYLKNIKHKKTGDKGTLNYGMSYLTDDEVKQLEMLIRDFMEDKVPREGTKAYKFGFVLFRKYE